MTKSANRYQFKEKENWSLHTEFRFTQWTSLFKELGLYVAGKFKRVKNKAHSPFRGMQEFQLQI